MENKSIHQLLDEAIQESITADPKMAKYKDWVYKDLPRMVPNILQEFKDLVGEDNLYWITFADYGDTCRGQILIAPDGMDRIAEHNRRKMN